MDVKMVGATLVVLAVLGFLFFEYEKRSLTRRLERLMEAQDFRGCLALLAEPVTRTVFPRYNRRFLELSCHLGLDNLAEAERLCSEMLAMRLTPEQRTVTLAKAFNVAVEREDRETAARRLAQIEELDDGALAQESRETFDVLLNGSSAYVESMKRRLRNADQGTAARLCYLLSVQYANRGDDTAAEQYLDRAGSCFDAPVEG
ncbi:hypothetical protein QJ043_05405 [Olsenella sp. YH-ols2217]|uniref:Tetratricopeptide repeat protein n=1 Tax=Kribbibacterium absianum TaxID=3044210 RepID=A0ABT6ZKC7_9ACTN|nr:MULTISPECIES: hypothetical protein [unclassified Olsenella]MDJ1122524.1 hypothetical protein [Olsenella sp. YH-ols2216]MDJ1129516.1 hypothetical protein [Olsenella sp. YH-ols2217]